MIGHAKRTIDPVPLVHPVSVIGPHHAVVCHDVVKEFSNGPLMLRVLDHIDVSFTAGQLSMLVGPSGCGKTTLISAIAGILTVTSGRVQVFGQNIDQMRGAGLARFRLRNIGFVFQQYNLLPTLTAAENAAVPLAAAGVSRQRAIAAGKTLLTRLGLADHVNKLPSQLSGGQQQRVAIARALVHEPRLVVCDEPTAALDAASGHGVMELLKTVAVAPDRACIIVTHDHRVFSFADAIVEMEDGRIKSRDHRAQESVT